MSLFGSLSGRRLKISLILGIGGLGAEISVIRPAIIFASFIDKENKSLMTNFKGEESVFLPVKKDSIGSLLKRISVDLFIG